MPNRPPTHRPIPTRPRTREDRPSAAARGYTRRWREYRLSYLRAHPLCQAEGCNQPATDVDHVQPITGPDDPLFWDVGNHQGLCHACHSRKTGSEDRGQGRARGYGQGGR